MREAGAGAAGPKASPEGWKEERDARLRAKGVSARPPSGPGLAAGFPSRGRHGDHDGPPRARGDRAAPPRRLPFGEGSGLVLGRC